MKSLKDTLDEEVTKHRRHARKNYRSAYSLSMLAILASAVAGLSVARELFSTTVLAILSAIPAFVLMLSERLKLEPKSTWHWKKSYALQSLLSQLEYEGASEKDVAQARRQLHEQFENERPGGGGT